MPERFFRRLLGQLVGMHRSPQDIITEAHELVAGRVPISSVSRHR
jgi:hypothetical protein